MTPLNHWSVRSKTACVHQAIQDYLEVNGYTPTLRDIVDLAGLSSTSVARFRVKQLEHAGIVRLTPRVARGIVLLKRLGEL